MTDHSATPPQVDFPDVPPSEHDLVEWARKIISEPPVPLGPSVWNHQRELWMRSYQKLPKSNARTPLGGDHDHNFTQKRRTDGSWNDLRVFCTLCAEERQLYLPGVG